MRMGAMYASMSEEKLRHLLRSVNYEIEELQNAVLPNSSMLGTLWCELTLRKKIKQRNEISLELHNRALNKDVEN
jgi:hypothetical protein